MNVSVEVAPVFESGRQRGREMLSQCQAVKWKLTACVVFSSEIASRYISMALKYQLPGMLP